MNFSILLLNRTFWASHHLWYGLRKAVLITDCIINCCLCKLHANYLRIASSNKTKDVFIGHTLRQANIPRPLLLLHLPVKVWSAHRLPNASRLFEVTAALSWQAAWMPVSAHACVRACVYVWLTSPHPSSHLSCKNMQSSCTFTISTACISCHQLTQRNTEVPMLTDFTCGCASRCTPECVLLGVCLCAPFCTNTLANVMQLSKAQPASPFSS